jgi:hypothetical protein
MYDYFWGDCFVEVSDGVEDWVTLKTEAPRPSVKKNNEPVFVETKNFVSTQNELGDEEEDE